MVICADCGNNCCNAGTGEKANGERCGCDEAYDHQDLYWKDASAVVFTSSRRFVT